MGAQAPPHLAVRKNANLGGPQVRRFLDRGGPQVRQLLGLGGWRLRVLGNGVQPPRRQVQEDLEDLEHLTQAAHQLLLWLHPFQALCDRFLAVTPLLPLLSQQHRLLTDMIANQNDLSDNDDVLRQCCKLYAQANMLALRLTSPYKETRRKDNSELPGLTVPSPPDPGTHATWEEGGGRWGWVNKSENRRVGELAKNQQGNSNARANIDRATYTDGQKERGMEEWNKVNGEVSKNKDRVIKDEEANMKSQNQFTVRKMVIAMETALKTSREIVNSPQRRQVGEGLARDARKKETSSKFTHAYGGEMGKERIKKILPDPEKNWSSQTSQNDKTTQQLEVHKQIPGTHRCCKPMFPATRLRCRPMFPATRRLVAWDSTAEGRPLYPVACRREGRHLYPMARRREGRPVFPVTPQSPLVLSPVNQSPLVLGPVPQSPLLRPSSSSSRQCSEAAGSRLFLFTQLHSSLKPSHRIIFSL
ncbi:hypothetical protein EYF80_027736 [Liparis tanakae]|uniref:Uncharacterized protein n=1 Tax=Liparis tanakae TaxID=230148 RepID=A0A4Z2H9Y1_9TELE|nr:hypothetical protein EYF80_027736 [Liparis tanakae]